LFRPGFPITEKINNLLPYGKFYEYDTMMKTKIEIGELAKS